VTFVASAIEVKLTNFGGDLGICMIMVGSYFWAEVIGKDCTKYCYYLVANRYRWSDNLL